MWSLKLLLFVVAHVLHLVGANVTQSIANDTTAKMHRQTSSGSSRDGAAAKPVDSLNSVNCVGNTASSSMQISLDTLFKGASRHNDNTNEVNLLRLHSLLLKCCFKCIPYTGEHVDCDC